MSLYQFMIAVRYDGAHTLTDADGETTRCDGFFFFFFRAQIKKLSFIHSHLQGMFYRTIRLISNGIKPVYVFDGKPPTLKSGELAKRYEKRGMQNSFASPL
jgi:flap endonuclease-1